MRSLKLACWALLAGAIVGSIESVVADPETLGAALLVWLWVVPSILLFVGIERYTVRRKWAAHISYFVSLLPVTAACIVVLLRPDFEGVAHEIALLILGCYLFEALGSYAVLFLSTRRR
jgi:surface polysaccharide O-acyltransferase-like enzyme